MVNSKTYENGLKLVVNKIDGLFSVTAGIIVKTGSKNETAKNNGISHFIEHMLFKGTPTRSSFDISDQIDRIGAQINAFTSKEMTCFYTKSIAEHFEESIEILSDLFFNSTFDEEETVKEKGVVIEEINMCEDTPEDLCLDILAESYFGKDGIGQTILGSVKNVESFTKADIDSYMSEYYVPSNTVISIAGNVSFTEAERITDKYFASTFKHTGKASDQICNKETFQGNMFKVKDIEQAHISLCMPSSRMGSKMTPAVSILNTVFGGGMSSRLFQRIREKLGLAYSVYSYVSQYEKLGTLEIYAGVNPSKRDLAYESIIKEIKELKKSGITESEFLRGKEQVKAAFIMSQESTSSQMMLYGKQMLFLNKIFDFNEKISDLNKCSMDDINVAIDENFDLSKLATAYVGKKRSKLKR